MKTLVIDRRGKNKAKKAGLIAAMLGVLVIGAWVAPRVESATSPVANIQVTQAQPRSMELSWTTAEAMPSRVLYGETVSYGLTASNGANTQQHSVSITGLTPGVRYYYQIVDGDDTPLGGVREFVTPYSFGVLTGSVNANLEQIQLNDMYERGVQYKTFELAWDRIETGNGTYDQTYITQKKQELDLYRSRGYNVVLDLGIHYTPAWVRTIDANALFMNQYGDTYAPGEAGKNVANTVFNQTVRNRVNQYIQKVFSEFGTNFFASRAGGGWYGELHYPSNGYNGRNNAFWGYDANAQGAASNRPIGIAPNPVPGWVPSPINNGTFENGDDASWLLSNADELIHSDAHRGSTALQKTNPGGFTNQTQQLSVELVPGRSYTASAWVKSTNPDTPACFQLVRADLSTEITFQCSDANAWTQISHTFTAQDTTARLSLLTWSGSPAVLTYDDVSITAAGYTYDADNSNAQAFLDWYRDSLNNYQNWQIEAYRDAGFTGEIFMLYPGYGVRNQADTGWSNEAVSYDLSYTSVGIKDGSIQRGEDWEQSIGSLPNDDRVSVYTTWLDAVFNDASTNKAHWSPAKYLAEVTRGTGRALYGENTGNNSPLHLSQTIDNMIHNHYSGMFWFNQNQLYSGVFSSMNNYGTEISALDRTAPYNLTMTSTGLSEDGRTVSLALSAFDNVTIEGDLEMIFSEDPDFSSSAYQPFSVAYDFALSGDRENDRVVYFAVRDSQGNVSNPVSLQIAGQSAPVDEGGDSPTPAPIQEEYPGVPNTGFQRQGVSVLYILGLLIGVGLTVLLVVKKRVTHKKGE